MKNFYTVLALCLVVLSTSWITPHNIESNDNLLALTPTSSISNTAFSFSSPSHASDSEMTCGSIVGVKIYDQSTDDEVPGIGVLYDGMSISTSDLPASYYIAIETSGSIESVKIWLDNYNESTENILPYTYPSGAEEDYNWNGGVGTYDLDAQAYQYDDGNNLCGSIWLSFSIYNGGGCDDVTDAGYISTNGSVCADESFTISNASSPTGGSGALEYIWLSNSTNSVSGSSVISGANGSSLTTSITESTWFRRCAQRVGCSGYMNGESNWVYVATEPTPNNLQDEVTVECGDAYPNVTFDNGTVLEYEDYSDAYKSCEIDLSTYPSYNWRNFWAHSFLPDVQKHFVWNNGNIIFLNDGTLRLTGRVENVDDNNSGFLIDFYFEELVDQATFLADGGYNETDSNAALRIFANVDFSKPNAVLGFGSFSDSDISLVADGSQHHMSLGERDVYGGYGFGFWIDYEGTVNGIPVGNSANPSGSNYFDMYSAINTCYEGSPSCDGEEFVIREWIVEDECGDEYFFIQHINVVDTEAPVASNVPANVAVECDEALPTDAPTFTDNCDDDLTITESEVTNPLACQEEMVRTWTATDDCGNATTVTQTIAVTDTTAPTLTGVPSNVTVECADDVLAPAQPAASDNCDPNPTLGFNESSEMVGCVVTMTRTWTVTDDCGNATFYTQLITVEDTTSPEVETAPADVTIECNEALPTEAATFSDNCDDDLTITFGEVESGNGCPLVITRTWTATDDCGNAISTSQEITVIDTTSPVASIEPADVSVECDEALPTDAPTFTDNCDDDLTITESEVTNPLACQEEMVRTWTATDDCGNATTVTQTITVTDTTAPTLTGV
ncbi:MAG: hypothetical protein ACI8U0_001793, partial [Flavobacteriales bacterium]